ncbi:hypothetical protein F5883DRAFT_540604 [Diaporthe sp. PMI_573]|nr:hypothetical protein F5883DRAFT_540604 [Diaporthaceae sp. PMI_573]
MVDSTNKKNPCQQAGQRIDCDDPAALPITDETVRTKNGPVVPLEAEEGRSSEIRHLSSANTSHQSPSIMAGENDTQPSKSPTGGTSHSKSATSPGRSSLPKTNGSREDKINAEKGHKAGGNEIYNTTSDSPSAAEQYLGTEPMRYENPAINQDQVAAEDHKGHCRSCCTSERCIRVWELVKRPCPKEMRRWWGVKTIWATWVL